MKIFIVMPAYNVEKLIGKVLSRIPGGIWRKIIKVITINDGSYDRTLDEVRRLKQIYPKIELIHKSVNEGYARAQKTGFRYALKNGADTVVLLHSDGQYAPEVLGKLLRPLEQGQADIVQGSRILGGKAISGGMPLYKFIANRVLSYLENLVYGMNLKEYHSGYMLYSRHALKVIPYQKLSDTFHFDGEMLLVGHKKGLRIKEVPIPTFYGKEKSNLKPLKYGLDVLKIMLDYKLGKYDFRK